jgi:hypothetical protein
MADGVFVHDLLMGSTIFTGLDIAIYDWGYYKM